MEHTKEPQRRVCIANMSNGICSDVFGKIERSGVRIRLNHCQWNIYVKPHINRYCTWENKMKCIKDEQQLQLIEMRKVSNEEKIKQLIEKVNLILSKMEIK